VLRHRLVQAGAPFMSRRGRGNRVKKTVVYRGLFGEKHIDRV